MDMDDAGAVTRRRVVGYVMAGAMTAAPFLALLFGLTAGLAVLAGALGATTFLVVDAARSVAPARRRRLSVAAAVNAALGLACAVAVAVRIV